MFYRRKFIENCERNFDNGIVPATSISIYAAVFKDENVLLIQEDGQRGLPGKWKLIGGYVEIDQVKSSCGGLGYQGSAIDALNRQLFSQAGIQLDFSYENGMQLVLLPLWQCGNDSFDIAFVSPFDWIDIKDCGPNNLFQGDRLKFFSLAETKRLQMTSPSMKFMIDEAFHFKERQFIL
ncbi:MAG: hypothetical protein MNSN_11120 [Minisyncoccus archaeiphilus]|jgi:hypothetical protein|uniref:hypothetical protein n=1 Tax=Minisyncoccus archaeiphilus TaxID=3238481 RepID=UPI002B075C97|nr:MAG: hypothetical protein MNSN_11120 [Candidatus Parcubacteria bacterium]